MEEQIIEANNLSTIEDVEKSIKDFIEENIQKLGDSIKDGIFIEIDFEELLLHSTELADKLIERPIEMMDLLNECIEKTTVINKKLKARFINLPESTNIQIRDIRAKQIGNFITIQGIIRQATDVRPQVTKISFECATCGSIIIMIQNEKNIKTPSRCGCGRRSGFKVISKDMTDSQLIILEESPDDLYDNSNQPKRMNIFLKDDLVDPKFESRTTPGTKVKIHGVPIEIAVQGQKGTLTRYDLAIEANNIIPMEEDLNDLEITDEEKEKIKEVANGENTLDVLKNSIAPSIYGHNNVKKALAFQLLGGVDKTRMDGTKIRGRHHCLLIGSPGSGKSMLLSFMHSVTPRSRFVSGKSTSSIGLTASVVRDEVTKGWGLEAGAMVLANGSMVMIDELDKMADEDRSSLHETMSLGTVTISKATVQACLQAKTAVLAAANPKYGRFNDSMPLNKQINIVDSLLDRFDYLFIIRDDPDVHTDDKIADKILSDDGSEGVGDILSTDMLKKYVSYAKTNFSPKMTKEAKEVIKTFYMKLRKRKKTDDDSVPIQIGARQLESLVRMAESHAKMKLKNTVDKEDAEIAIGIMMDYLMDMGYDKETGKIDIDKISGTSTSKRHKIIMFRQIIKELEKVHGKVIEENHLIGIMTDKVNSTEYEEMKDALKTAGELIVPKRGFIQLID